jgi:hypothetical protein
VQDRTGGRKSFSLQGQTSVFKLDLLSPVHGSLSPGLGKRMNSGRVAFCSAILIDFVVRFIRKDRKRPNIRDWLRPWTFYRRFFIHFFIHRPTFLGSFENTWDKAHSIDLPMKNQVRALGKKWAYSLGNHCERDALPI